MPAYFKKRRGPQGPNKNEEKVQRAREAKDPGRSFGLLGMKFPSVKRLKVHVVFLDARQNVLEEKDFSLGPNDPAALTIPCPGRCGSGSFDLAGKIEQMATTALSASESGAKCPEPLYASSPEACGCEIRCKMEIEYLPAPPPVA